MPEECVREIILRINDHRDLEASSAAWTLMAALASEQRVWRELTQFHFTKHQIDQIIQKQFNNNSYNNKNYNENNSNNTNNSNNDTGNNQSDMNLNSISNTEKKTSKRAANTKDWQKIYHALRR